MLQLLLWTVSTVKLTCETWLFQLCSRPAFWVLISGAGGSLAIGSPLHLQKNPYKSWKKILKLKKINWFPTIQQPTNSSKNPPVFSFSLKLTCGAVDMRLEIWLNKINERRAALPTVINVKPFRRRASIASLYHRCPNSLERRLLLLFVFFFFSGLSFSLV